MMRLETFNVKAKELASKTGLPVSGFKVDLKIDEKAITVTLDEGNMFTVTGLSLGDAYEHALRIIKGYGPKMLRGKRPKKVEKSAE